MVDLEDTNQVLMDEIDKAIEVHLGEEVGSFWVARKHEEKQLHPHVRKKKQIKKKQKTKTKTKTKTKKQKQKQKERQ